MNNVLAGRYELTAEQTGGTVANVSLIETGEVEIGIVATDILYGAYTGTASWANGVKYQKPPGHVHLRYAQPLPLHSGRLRHHHSA